MTLTRTDFLIQFVYQPPTAEAPAKPREEIQKAMDEAVVKTKGAVKPPTDEELIAASSKATQQFIQGFIEAQNKGQAAGDAAPAATPGAAPGPGGAAPPSPK